LVREAEDRGVGLTALARESFVAAHSAFEPDCMDELVAENSMRHREVPGGTGPRAVAQQLKSAEAALLGGD
jgi:argininosuccinate lyase